MTIVPGPSSGVAVRPCDDVAQFDTVTIDLLLDAAPPVDMVVDLSIEGQGAPPTMSVPVPAGSNTVRATVVEEPVGPAAQQATALVTIQPGSGYTVGDPGSTTTEPYLIARDPSLGPVDCNPSFRFADVPSNRAQTIRVGQRPANLLLADGTTGRFDLLITSGALPPGVTIIGNDVLNSVLPLTAEEHAARFATVGTFAGAATTPGTFVAELRACPHRLVFTCRDVTLTVVVLPAAAVVLDRTG